MIYKLWKLYLKLNKRSYQKKILNWGKKNLTKSLFYLTFDIETHNDINVLKILYEKILKLNISPFFAVPGEFLKNNKTLFQEISDKSNFINHGYRVHTMFNKLKMHNESSLSYSNLSENEIFKDLELGHNEILKVAKVKPFMFRIPHFAEYSNKFELDKIYEFMANLGYTHSSSTSPISSYVNNPIYLKKKILEIPISGCLDNPMQIIDSWAFIGGPASLGSFKLKKSLNNYLNLMKNKKLILNIYFDPSDIVNDKELFIIFKKMNALAKTNFK